MTRWASSRASCSARQVQADGCDPASGSSAQATHQTYDAIGWVVLATVPVNTTATALVAAALTYDGGGRLTSTCDYPGTGVACTNTTAQATTRRCGRRRPSRVRCAWPRGSRRAARGDHARCEHLDDRTARALVADLGAATAGRTLLVLTHRPELFVGGAWTRGPDLGVVGRS